jgi:hypothetical protein
MILPLEWVVIETLEKYSVWIVAACLNELLPNVISQPFRASVYVPV